MPAEPDESYTINLFERGGAWEGELWVGPLLDVSCTGPDKASVLAVICEELMADAC